MNNYPSAQARVFCGTSRVSVPKIPSCLVSGFSASYGHQVSGDYLISRNPFRVWWSGMLPWSGHLVSLELVLGYEEKR